MIRFSLLLGIAVAAAAPLAAAQNAIAPDALSGEWHGKKLCEKLFEDTQTRILRCTFPPGSMAARHSHPGAFTYVLSGGKAQFQDQKGTRQVEVRTDTYANSPPIPWHVVSNVGDTTLRALVVERKYEPAGGSSAKQATDSGTSSSHSN